jgi:NhaP-type Na+/H+ or K+/H+ antiporter
MRSHDHHLPDDDQCSVDQGGRRAIKLGDLREHWISIGVLAVVGTPMSTVIGGGLCWLFTRSLELGWPRYVSAAREKG